MSTKDTDIKLQNKFFDRQIQIFGEDVQHKITKTQVQVFTCDPTSSEILKNLVLIGFNTVITSKEEFKDDSYMKNPLIYPGDISESGFLCEVLKEKLQKFSNFNQVQILDELDNKTDIIVCRIKNKVDFEVRQNIFKDHKGLIVYFCQNNFSLFIFVQQEKKLNKKFFECFKNSENTQFQDFYQKFEENQDFSGEPEVFISSICGSFINQAVLQYIQNKDLIFSAISLNLGDFLDNPVELNASQFEKFDF